MNEYVLRAFFEGEASAAELSRDLVDTKSVHEPVGFRSSANYRVDPMARQFFVSPTHVIRLVDAVLSDALSVEDLGTLVFCMEAAPERWVWSTDETDGERVGNALFWLGSPEVNYPLTPDKLHKIRTYLTTGEEFD